MQRGLGCASPVGGLASTLSKSTAQQHDSWGRPGSSRACSMREQARLVCAS